MIGPGADARVLVATRPVDFRKGADSLAALVKAEHGADPFSGVVYVFRAKRADRIKLVWWDGTGLWLMAKRLEQGRFRWPVIQDGVMRLTAAQFGALVEGLAGVGCMAAVVRSRRNWPVDEVRAGCFTRTVLAEADLPDDPALLRAMLVEARGEVAQQQARIVDLEGAGTDARAEIERLTAIIAAFQRHRFGARSEQLDPDQLALALEELDAAVSRVGAGLDASGNKPRAPRARDANRGRLPAHLERVEQVVDVESKACACCGGALHVIGEDVAERLDVVPTTFRVLVTRRPRYGCRACEAAPVQAPAPARIVEGGMPTEALIAHVLVGKYADHLPLYRQAQIYARQGVTLDRSTLADWVGRAAWWLTPLRDHLLADLKRSPGLFADETTAPVLAPVRAAPGQASSGLTLATTGRGAAPIHPPSPTSMRRTGRRSARPSTSGASPACCRSTAMPDIARSAARSRSISRSAGAMCAAASTRSPHRVPPRPRRWSASRSSTRSSRRYVAMRPTSAAPCARAQRPAGCQPAPVPGDQPRPRQRQGQARRGDPLCAEPLGRALPVPR